MSLWFLICAACFFVAIPLHFRSVEPYQTSEEIRKGKRNEDWRDVWSDFWNNGALAFDRAMGSATANICHSDIAGLGYFDLSIPLLHLVVSLPLTVVGAWFGIEGARTTGWKAAETHSVPKRIITGGVYAIVRHPQYLE